jgi:hypothetical protein
MGAQPAGVVATERGFRRSRLLASCCLVQCVHICRFSSPFSVSGDPDCDKNHASDLFLGCCGRRRGCGGSPLVVRWERGGARGRRAEKSSREELGLVVVAFNNAHQSPFILMKFSKSTWSSRPTSVSRTARKSSRPSWSWPPSERGPVINRGDHESPLLLLSCCLLLPWALITRRSSPSNNLEHTVSGEYATTIIIASSSSCRHHHRVIIIIIIVASCVRLLQSWRPATHGGLPPRERPASGRPTSGRPASGRPASGRQVGGRQVGGRQVGGWQVGGREASAADERWRPKGAGGRQEGARQAAVMWAPQHGRRLGVVCDWRGVEVARVSSRVFAA